LADAFISGVLKLKTEEELSKQFVEMENELDIRLKPLTEMLGKSIMSTDAGQLEQHMAFVEAQRYKLVRYAAVLEAMVNHIRGSFQLPKEKGITVEDRESNRYRLSAGFKGLQRYIEGLITGVDSRVNQCKMLLRLEEGFSTKMR
jgi:hypothetical protein